MEHSLGQRGPLVGRDRLGADDGEIRASPGGDDRRAKYPAETPPPTTTIFLATEELISALARAFRVGLVCRRRAGEEEVRTFGVTSIEKEQRDEETCGFRPTKWKPLSPSAKRASDDDLDAFATGQDPAREHGVVRGSRYQVSRRAPTPSGSGSRTRPRRRTGRDTRDSARLGRSRLVTRPKGGRVRRGIPTGFHREIVGSSVLVYVRNHPSNTPGARTRPSLGLIHWGSRSWAPSRPIGALALAALAARRCSLRGRDSLGREPRVLHRALGRVPDVRRHEGRAVPVYDGRSFPRPGRGRCSLRVHPARVPPGEWAGTLGRCAATG